MTATARFPLFLSSYSPLFLVFALLNTFGGGWPTTLCFALAAVGLLLPVAVFLLAKQLASQSLHVESAQVRDGDALSYLVVYLVPFIAVAATTTREQIAVGLFVLLIGILYVRSELFYINPLFALAGFRLFQVATPSGGSAVLLTRRRFLRAEIDLHARRLGNYVYWEEAA